MITIWGRKNSSNVKKVLWCLEELNVPYQQVDIGGKFGKLNEPEYLRMNPNAVIPCLQEEGFILWESNTIVRYVAAKFGSDSLYPADLQERANVEKWMDWAGCNLFPLIKQFMISFVRTPKDQQDPETLSRILSEIERLLTIVNGTLNNQSYLSGEKFGMADITLAPLVYLWLNVEIERSPLPNLERWYQLLTKRSAFQKIVMTEIS